MITDSFDFLCLILVVVGTLLCVLLFALNGWDVERTLFCVSESDGAGNDVCTKEGKNG